MKAPNAILNIKVAKKFKKIHLAVIALAVLTVALTLGLYLKSKPAQKPQVAAATAGEVLELKEILGPDQTIRLLATRKLVERVGVEEALEILKNSGLPYTGEGHLAVHQVGFHAYEVYGKDAVLHCKDYFLSACYHGAIIEAASAEGTQVIKEMTDRCRHFAPTFFQCVHAAGHSINAIWNYDLPNALKTCDQLYEAATGFPDTLTSCHNGAFMENLFGVHDWGTENSPKKDWLSEDPYFPCNAMSVKYQKGCWLNQAARIYQMHNSDLVITAQLCEAIGNRQYTAWCIDNLSRQIHPLTESNINKVWQLCSQIGQHNLTTCVMINAVSYYSVGDRPLGIDVCNTLDPTWRSQCLVPIINYLLSDNIAKNQKTDLCRRIIGNDQIACLERLKSI